MKSITFVVGLFAGSMQLAGSAQAFTCDQVVWAVQTFSKSQLEAMAAKASQADRERAHKCLREAGTKNFQVKVKAAASSAPVP